MLVEAAADAPPQRVGAAVRLVPEICGEPPVSTDTRTRHGHTDTQGEGTAPLEASQISLWRKDGTEREREGGKDGRAPTTRPKRPGNTGGIGALLGPREWGCSLWECPLTKATLTHFEEL